MQVFKTEQLKCCSFDASPQSEWLITAHFRENLESIFWGFGVSYQQLDETHVSLQNGAVEMLQFWCLSPVRVAYHGSFRENLESAFWGLGLFVDPAVLRSLEVSAQPQVRGKALIPADVDRCQDRGFEMLQFWCLSPVRVAYHGSFRENLESAFWGFGALYHSLIRQMQAFKRSSWNVAVLMSLPSQSGLSRLI